MNYILNDNGRFMVTAWGGYRSKAQAKAQKLHEIRDDIRYHTEELNGLLDSLEVERDDYNACMKALKACNAAKVRGT